MKKIIFQVSLILLILIIGMLSVFITDSNATSKAKLNCPSSIEVGKNLTMSFGLDSSMYTASGDITITWSDGTKSSKRIVYVSGMADFPNSVTFTNVKVPGKATIAVTNIVLGNSGGARIESGGSLSTTINVTGGATSNPSDSSSSNPSSSNNNGGGTSDSNNSQVKFTDTNETVYTNDRVNLRKSYSTTSDRIKILEAGTKLTRTGVGNNGWSRVNYNGQTGYISSQYLTATQTTNNQPEEKVEDVKFTDVNEKVYASQNCNLRKSWSTSSDKAGYLTEGQEVTRTGVASNGWSRINYNGQVVYVATRLLTNKKPDENTNEITNEVSNEITNEITNELTDEQKLAVIQEEVGVLPEVGNNIANNLYVIITVIATILVSAGLYFYNKKSK